MQENLTHTGGFRHPLWYRQTGAVTWYLCKKSYH